MSKLKYELQAILFDVDGTLADTEEVHREAFNEVFKENGLDWYWSQDLYTDLLKVTGGKERMLHFINEHNPPGDLPEDLPAFVAELHAGKTRHYVSLIETGVVQLRPGIKRLLTEVHEAGMRMAVATTTTLVNVESLLSHSFSPDVVSWFEVIGAGNDAAQKKPAPDIYEFVLQKMGLSPEECIAFEDSANGVRSANGADLKTIVTSNHYTRHDSFEGALCVLDSLGEPGKPFSVLQGSVPEQDCVDLALTKVLHQQG